MKLPTFFILGVPKAGSTSLYRYLDQHPDILFSTVKETHFFNTKSEVAKGIPYYLRTYFPNSTRYSMIGEATPHYFYGGYQVASLMADVYGSCPPKFLVIFRDPVDRAWSHYRHALRLGIERESFSSALALENERLKQRPEAWLGYYKDGLYSSLLREWLEQFDRQQFLFMLTDDLYHRPLETLNEICDFLDVARWPFDIGRTHNVSRGTRIPFLNAAISNPPTAIRRPLVRLFPKGRLMWLQSRLRQLNYRAMPEAEPLNNEIALQLRRAYAADINQLETLIDRDLSIWREDTPGSGTPKTAGRSSHR